MDVGIQHHIDLHTVHPPSSIRIWLYNVVSGTADNQMKRREERKGKGKERKRGMKGVGQIGSDLI